MTYFRMVFFSALSLGALFAGACATSLDDERSGEFSNLLQNIEGGSDATTGTAGAAATTTIVCEAFLDAERAPGSCEADDAQNACQVCVQSRCCAEQEACYATSPESICGFGSTLFAGHVVDGGEIACMLECFDSRRVEGTLNGQFELAQDSCASECSASECGAQTASERTRNLSACILGLNAGDDGCAAECAFLE